MLFKQREARKWKQKDKKRKSKGLQKQRPQRLRNEAGSLKYLSSFEKVFLKELLIQGRWSTFEKVSQIEINILQKCPQPIYVGQQFISSGKWPIFEVKKISVKRWLPQIILSEKKHA